MQEGRKWDLLCVIHNLSRLTSLSDLEAVTRWIFGGTLSIRRPSDPETGKPGSMVYVYRKRRRRGGGSGSVQAWELVTLTEILSSEFKVASSSKEISVTRTKGEIDGYLQAQ